MLQPSFTVQYATPNRDSNGNYNYRIFKNGRLVAMYWHDFRGDEHGIDFLGGPSEEWPVGRMIEFLLGGGPQPLTLSEKAIKYLESKCS
jgi:hypothetical protein